MSTVRTTHLPGNTEIELRNHTEIDGEWAVYVTRGTHAPSRCVFRTNSDRVSRTKKREATAAFLAAVHTLRLVLDVA